MSYNDLAKSTGVDGIAALVDFLSLHEGNPGTTGANEISGGSPAYARKGVAFGAAAAGVATNSGAITFDVPAGKTIYHVGLWDAASAGNFYGYAPLVGTPRGFGSVAAATEVTTSVAHGLSDTWQVVVANVFAESLPTGLTEGDVYFVRDAAADSFKLALTSGGVAIDLGGGELAFQRCVPEVFGSQGTLTLAIGQFALDLTAA